MRRSLVVCVSAQTGGVCTSAEKQYLWGGMWTTQERVCACKLVHMHLHIGSRAFPRVLSNCLVS